jgi:CDP-glucose 4,6-dehydratase
VSHWKNRNVFVTGCTGLLGSSLTRHLVEQGANVVGLVRDSVPRSLLAQEGVLQQISVVHGALEDYVLLERALNEYEIEVVFHLAAQTIVGTANRSPLSTFEANIKGTWQLLEACRRVPTVKRVLFASSDKAYGDHEILPYQEDAPLIGRHPYDVSKSCSDLIAQSYHHTYGMNVCITRCGNLYGPGDLNFNRLIPGTIRSLLNDEKPVIRSDGSYIRDYFFVEDGVEAYLHLAEAMDRLDLGGHAFNFSNELQITVLELVNRITELMGRKDLAPLVLNQATGEIKHQYLSAEKARTMLDWHPRHTLEQGLDHTIRWYRNFLSENNQALPALSK